MYHISTSPDINMESETPVSPRIAAQVCMCEVVVVKTPLEHQIIYRGHECAWVYIRCTAYSRSIELKIGPDYFNEDK